jgi:RNA-directed DNA polymerase
VKSTLKGEMLMDKTKSSKLTETKLLRISKLSSEDPKMEFKWLMPHFNKGSLISCFNMLSGRKAVGIDGKTKEDYKTKLEENIENLINKMKQMAYRPAPVREVLIPKDGQKKKFRPLGISNFEDKIIQLMASKILNAIYEPIFQDFSYGFRPGRNCHMAVKDLSTYLYRNQCEVVIDVDLANFFGTINHNKLIQLLRLKIKDERFIRYIVRMLKAGVLSDGELRKTDEGSPQGSVVSPVLANIFAHYAIDIWFENTVKTNLKGKAAIFRYCDDMVICCEYQYDAGRIVKALNGRLERFSLKLNKDKTKVVPFKKRDFDKGIKQGAFDFLGFTYYIARSRKGGVTVKLKTSTKRLRTKLKNVKIWMKRYRHTAKLKDLWRKYCTKLTGHIQYYGVSYNYQMVHYFIQKATKIFYKWINRRSQRKSITWDKFNLFISKYPLPRIKIHHALF